MSAFWPLVVFLGNEKAHFFTHLEDPSIRVCHKASMKLYNLIFDAGSPFCPSDITENRTRQKRLDAKNVWYIYLPKLGVVLEVNVGKYKITLSVGVSYSSFFELVTRLFDQCDIFPNLAVRFSGFLFDAIRNS